MTHPIIRFDHATFGFPGIVALEDISLTIPESEFVGVIGPNGSGKTTLCRAVLGLMAPLSGTLRVLDCACEELRCHHRALIGYLPQKGMIDRNFPVTVLEAAMMGRYGALGLFRRPSQKDRDIARQALAQVGMDHHRDSALGALSGGQQQRVAIARALVNEPAILLADEPTGALDSKTGVEIMDLFQRLHRDQGQTVILVTHDAYVARHTTRIIKLSDGKIVSDEVNHHPIKAGAPRPEEVI